MRLVVFGYYGFGNAGDEAILVAMIAALRRREPTLELVVISGNPAETSRRHGVRAIGRGHIGVIRALMRSNGLVSGGGGLLQDSTSTRSLLYYAGVMLLAVALRRPVYVYAQGIGPVTGRLGRALAGLALRRASYVSVRDQGSLDEARSLGADAEVAADPAIGLSPLTPRTTRDRPTIVVAVRPAPGWAQLEEAFVAALRKLGEGHRLTFVAMQPAQDGPLAIRLAARVGPYTTVADYADLDELMEQIGSAALVIGMRLHALILAAAAGVPFVAVPYDPKVEAFAAAVKQPVATAVGGSLTATALVTLAREQLNADRASYRAAVAELARRAERPAEAIVAAVRARSPSD